MSNRASGRGQHSRSFPQVRVPQVEDRVVLNLLEEPAAVAAAGPRHASGHALGTRLFLPEPDPPAEESHLPAESQVEYLPAALPVLWLLPERHASGHARETRPCREVPLPEAVVPLVPESVQRWPERSWGSCRSN